MSKITLSFAKLNSITYQLALKAKLYPKITSKNQKDINIILKSIFQKITSIIQKYPNEILSKPIDFLKTITYFFKIQIFIINLPHCLTQLVENQKRQFMEQRVLLDNILYQMYYGNQNIIHITRSLLPII